jgi:plasmid stabilization system protein ParE
VIVRQKLKIEYNSTFRKNFGAIWDFISKDSIQRADSFKNQLKGKILNLSNSPYKFRQSYYYDNIDTRDMVFKGYTIPYLIDKEKNTIIILDIFKWSKR